jgi:hypothetical protein
MSHRSNMKFLVATGLTQGMEPNDYHYCVEGELVWIQEPCGKDRNDPDGPCGCGRGFAGAASHRATTTATVIESELSRDDAILAFQTSLVDGGWPIEWAENVTDENLAIADHFPIGCVIGRQLDGFLLRAVVLGRRDS